MSSSRWAASLLIVGHLMAIGIAIIPPPSGRPEVDASNLARGAAAAVASLSTAVHAAGPIQAAVNAYIGVLGLRQRWNMFSKPPANDEYMRVRYYVATSTSPGP